MEIRAEQKFKILATLEKIDFLEKIGVQIQTKDIFRNSSEAKIGLKWDILTDFEILCIVIFQLNRSSKEQEMELKNK